MRRGFIRLSIAGLTALLAALFLNWGCAGTPSVTGSVSFIIFGNTKPESPFTGFTESLGPVLADINKWKPEILIHTGNSVYGGIDSDGILEQDVNRQMKIFITQIKSIPTAAYTIPGESDYYNQSLKLYTDNYCRPPYYSFNYGTIHFITLNTDSSTENLLDPAQMNWLRQELDEAGNYSAIFILTHHPVNVEEKTKKETVLKNTGLMELFSSKGVRAVFSGRDEKYGVSSRGNVEYYLTGCGGYIDKKDNKKKYQYYVVTYNAGRLEITPQRINLDK